MDAKFFDATRTEDQFDITIDRNGQWYHQGTAIGREKLVKLFSTALHYNPDTNEYWLITPHEQGRVQVEDAPYIIQDFEMNGTELNLKTNLNHNIIPDRNNPIYLKNNIPYCIVSNNVPARINRSVREKLIDIALHQNGYDDLTKKLILKANNHDHIIACS